MSPGPRASCEVLATIMPSPRASKVWRWGEHQPVPRPSLRGCCALHPPSHSHLSQYCSLLEEPAPSQLEAGPLLGSPGYPITHPPCTQALSGLPSPARPSSSHPDARTHSTCSRTVAYTTPLPGAPLLHVHPPRLPHHRSLYLSSCWSLPGSQPPTASKQPSLPPRVPSLRSGQPHSTTEWPAAGHTGQMAGDGSVLVRTSTGAPPWAPRGGPHSARQRLVK